MNNQFLMSDFIIGSSSACLASLCVYPIDVIKTQIQVNSVNKRTNVTTINVIRDILKTQGFRGFYRGFTPNLLTYPIFWGIFFELGKKPIFPSTGYKYGDKFLISTCSGIIASVLTNPLFVFKVKVQTENLKGNVKQSYPQLAKSIYNAEGIRGYYKGLGATLLNNTKLGLQMPLVDYLSEKTNSVTIGSAVGKIASSAIFYPMDLIRTNQRESKTKLPLMDITKNIYKTNGLLGFYRGLVIYTAMTGPNFILMMIFRDKLTNMI